MILVEAGGVLSNLGVDFRQHYLGRRRVVQGQQEQPEEKAARCLVRSKQRPALPRLQ